ncbi:unnamed protein product [Oppiella nova]|uniref:Complex III subunit 9 n=1 Tax=Oppiella nova TaxID=334625 RepID=A0A7R9QX07_9ACAR|nr:unnamed protein product [Oppiella nova]CAD7666175.1 unnamed protein product [Oppiella nova]CAG2177512.1 unnamed protein product [Oppiella nova]CAG2183286.1 unnamed protein product [Oppiella nova]
MAGLVSTLYRSVLNRTSTTMVVVILGALFYERGASMISDSIFDSVNRGKQWKDIKHLYEN